MTIATPAFAQDSFYEQMRQAVSALFADDDSSASAAAAAAPISPPSSQFGFNIPGPPGYYSNKLSFMLCDLMRGNVLNRDGSNTVARNLRGDPLEPANFAPFWYFDSSDIGRPFILTTPASVTLRQNYIPARVGVIIEDLGVSGDLHRQRITWTKQYGLNNDGSKFGPADLPLNGWLIAAADLPKIAAASQPISLKREGDTCNGYLTGMAKAIRWNNGVTRGMDFFGVNVDSSSHDNWDAEQGVGRSARSYQEFVDAAGVNSTAYRNIYMGATDAWMIKDAAFLKAQTQWKGRVLLEIGNETWGGIPTNRSIVEAFGIALGLDIGDGRQGARAPLDRLKFAGQVSTYQAGDLVRATYGAYYKVLADTPASTPFGDTSKFQYIPLSGDQTGLAALRFVAYRLIRASIIYGAALGQDRVTPVLSSQMGNRFGREYWEFSVGNSGAVTNWSPDGVNRLIDFQPERVFAPYLGYAITMDQYRAFPDRKAGLIAALKADAETMLTFLAREETAGTTFLKNSGFTSRTRKSIGIYELGLHLTGLNPANAAEAAEINAIRDSPEMVAMLTDYFVRLKPLTNEIAVYQETGVPSAPGNPYVWGFRYGSDYITGQGRAMLAAAAAK